MGRNSPETRLGSIAWLAENLQAPVDIESLRLQEVWARRVHDMYGILPTIGCEVEVALSALQPDLCHNYFGEPNALGRFPKRYDELPFNRQREFDERYEAFCTSWRPRYQATVEAGIPRGKDAYWEFANLPTYHWETLATELDFLFRRQLIPEGFEHSLHVTVGGVDLAGGGMSLVISGLELLHVSPQRILAATAEGRRANRHGAWAVRGIEGLRLRNGDQLELNEVTATELRTLAVSSAQQAKHILYTTQVLSTILLAYRKRHEASQSTTQELATLWAPFTAIIKDVWSAKGLPAEPWGTPQHYPAYWQRWAECLRDRGLPSTLEAKAADSIESLIYYAATLLAAL